ncbi:MAG: hypothetical protein OXE53_07530, partial [Deltaproteobacteria bacterium]|nr:hypothetical protein [Deltaproteobacteria bacterium]
MDSDAVSPVYPVSPVSHIRRPRLRRPFLILSFSGWSDAGSSATSAVRYLIEQLLASELAKIDP